jgi:hypothetical protein
MPAADKKESKFFYLEKKKSIMNIMEGVLKKPIQKEFEKVIIFKKESYIF